MQKLKRALRYTIIGQSNSLTNYHKFIYTHTQTRTSTQKRFAASASVFHPTGTPCLHVDPQVPMIPNQIDLEVGAPCHRVNAPSRGLQVHVLGHLKGPLSVERTLTRLEHPNGNALTSVERYLCLCFQLCSFLLPSDERATLLYSWKVQVS